MTVKRQVDQGATLTQATYFGRMFVKYGIIAVILLMVGRVLINASVAYWIATHPAPPPPPTVGFGRLPKIVFPDQKSIDKPETITLELANGNFPSFSDRAKVFLYPKKTVSLFDDQKAKSVAKGLGFTSEPQIIDSQTYRWTKISPLDMAMQLDILDLTFKIKSNYADHPEFLVRKNLPENFEAVKMVKDYVGKAIGIPTDVATSSGRVTYLRVSGSSLSVADSLGDADYARVDINRTPIDGQYFMYTPKGLTGIISALVGSAGNANSILEIESYYLPVDYYQVETYPLRSVKNAWSNLQAGEGYIADKGTQKNAVIRSVSLGYYDDFKRQTFLQPIYIFEGDFGFLGYVSAIDPRYLDVE